MASASLNSASDVQPVVRLAAQLQSLSELTESLAFRLLELEERLAAQELRLESLVQAEGAGSDHGADTELRLDDTEERLARLEALLSGLASPGAARHGAGVLPLSRPERDVQANRAIHRDPDLGEEPFYEEEEQLFMDEQPFLDDTLSGAISDGEELDRLDSLDRLSA
jgi:hypothetical protein